MKEKETCTRESDIGIKRDNERERRQSEERERIKVEDKGKGSCGEKRAIARDRKRQR